MKRLLPLLLLTLLASCSDTARTSTHEVSGHNLFKTQPDAETTRRIVLSYPYTHEKLDLIYFHDGNYDKDALAQIDRLLRDRHADVVGDIDPELIDYLTDIRTRLGLPPSVDFQILSGYRTRETNESLAISNSQVAKESLHMRGWAVDFRVVNVDGKAIAEIARTMQRGGVAYYPKDNHVHVDLGNIRTWNHTLN